MTSASTNDKRDPGAPHGELDIVLYSYWRSSSAWRVRIALNLKQLPHRLVPVNLVSSAQHDPGFRETNPMQQVPVLEVQLEGKRLKLSQSLAIVDLLEQLAPDPALYPGHPPARALALEAAEIINSGIQPLQNVGAQQQVSTAGGDATAFTTFFINKGMAALEDHAMKHSGRFSIGDTLTVADVLLVPQLYAARRFGADMSRYPNLLRIEQTCQGVPAFERAHPNRQPDVPAGP